MSIINKKKMKKMKHLKKFNEQNLQNNAWDEYLTPFEDKDNDSYGTNRELTNQELRIIWDIMQSNTYLNTDNDWTKRFKTRGLVNPTKNGNRFSNFENYLEKYNTMAFVPHQCGLITISNHENDIFHVVGSTAPVYKTNEFRQDYLYKGTFDEVCSFLRSINKENILVKSRPGYAFG